MHSHEPNHRNDWQQQDWSNTWHMCHTLANQLCTGLQKIPHFHCQKCAYFTSKLFGAQSSNLLHQHTQITSDSASTFWFHTLLSCSATIKSVVWQAKLSLALRWAFELTAFQQFKKQTDPNTWLWKFEQGGIHFMTITFLPNNKVSHVEVLAVNKEWASSCGQRQFFYSCNMMMQNLKNRR